MGSTAGAVESVNIASSKKAGAIKQNDLLREPREDGGLF